MAINLLSISGGLMVSKHHHAPKDQSVPAAMTVCSWTENELVPMEELTSHFNNKHKHTGKAKSQPVDKGKGKEIVMISDDDESDLQLGGSEKEDTKSDSDSD
ncbi:hypothetical protein K435DRAFT_869093 [Dendrothele bispora CBS 962.96]|uniref:Uncharacterized protein n=1 Tax=Dendrothele bispora (strain CBS 962.96) TaxID=1314807 RepID=A0A4S8LA00_DENBC|nr:hypothetical protein K435DRAFT_869093 [Dendrothele bispora CBS 962.96]